MYQPGDLVEAQSHTWPSTILTGVIAEVLDREEILLLPYNTHPVICDKPRGEILLASGSQLAQLSFQKWQQLAREGKYRGLAKLSAKQRVFLTQEENYGLWGTIFTIFPGGRIGLDCSGSYKTVWPAEVLPITVLSNSSQEEVWAIPMSYAAIVTHPNNVDITLAPTYIAALNMLRHRSLHWDTEDTFSHETATLEELNEQFASGGDPEEFKVEIAPLLNPELVLLPEKQLPGAPLSHLKQRNS